MVETAFSVPPECLNSNVLGLQIGRPGNCSLIYPDSARGS